MAISNPNAAYNLDLFDEENSLSSAAPKKDRSDSEKQQIGKNKKTKAAVVKLPEDELNRIRRRRHNPVKLIAGTLSAAAVTLVIGTIIVGQVQLTELNQKIITAQSELEDAQSIYTQNQMKLEAKLSNAEIERYAKEELGMTKASNSQKEFIALEGGDKAEVSVQKSENIFTQFIESIKNLWS